jgi:type IV pilus biogenesis protein CpaD/CtpE
MLRKVSYVVVFACALAGCASMPAKPSGSATQSSTTTQPILGAEPPSQPAPAPTIDITTTIPPK